MYWPHTDPYPGTGACSQPVGHGAGRVVRSIRRFRSADPSGRSTLATARGTRLASSGCWVLSPGSWLRCRLPRLQRIGNVADRSSTNSDGTRPSLVGSSSMRIRPFVHLRPAWAPSSFVCPACAAASRTALDLSGGCVQPASRRSPRRVPLSPGSSGCRSATARARSSSRGDTVSTERPLQTAQSDVDHFLPWSRSPVNAIENLVVADGAQQQQARSPRRRSPRGKAAAPQSPPGSRS